MGKANIGELIKTATKNISYNREITEQEASLANELALSIREKGRNWVPVYVRELGRHNYQLIGSPVILEATKRADQKVAYCIQVDEDEGVANQIEKAQILQASDGNGSSVDLTPIQRKLESIKQTLERQQDRAERIFQQVVPDTELLVNLEPQRTLEAKLGNVNGIGEKRLNSVVEDIINHRPFYDEFELKSGVKLLQPKKTKAKNPLYQQLWKNITNAYRINYETRV